MKPAALIDSGVDLGTTVIPDKLNIEKNFLERDCPAFSAGYGSHSNCSMRRVLQLKPCLLWIYLASYYRLEKTMKHVTLVLLALFTTQAYAAKDVYVDGYYNNLS